MNYILIGAGIALGFFVSMGIVLMISLFTYMCLEGKKNVKRR
jgi:hypothetical protein